ncbi:helix-turn-helix domain-containing protein [Mycobacteroides abscessus]|uniref:hypothetical protein n=1 Tax=Mycobacteroides abscessus TaxID=36809 RepID=UPI00092A19B7|nr:hypothetical protein [Mycobacteroides abscessus]SHX09261.1 Uncharacterised protein [Mycobacteroides abscessus subsp. abscessus]SHY19347.1 Uncharacterised protein [Mycobacteroides abscessus subsp. abscessus]
MLTFEDRRKWTRLVLRMPSAELSASCKTVLLALESYADYRDGTGAHPGEENLSKAADVNVRTVRRALATGRALGLIEQTSAANSKAGKAAEYSLTLPGGAAVTTGHPCPVDNSTTGHPSPVDNSTTGHPSPVETVHDRTNATPRPDTGVLPPKPYTNNLGVLRNSGTSPAPRITEDTHPEPPSRFCDEHPMGTRGNCGNCANARTAFNAWQAHQAVRDVEIAQADTRRRHEQRVNCPWCRGTNVRDIGDDLVEKCDHQSPPQARRTLSLVPPLPGGPENVRAAQ